MTTDPRHLAALCEIVEGKKYRIVEFGSHAGISASAMALASPESTIFAVDLCDTVPEAFRVSYWQSLGITNVIPVAYSTSLYLADCQPDEFDVAFHDAVHGVAAFLEYVKCADIAKVVAIHDFEQLPEDMQATVAAKFHEHTKDADVKGRVLFVGFR
jgi:predicted O-methyltransferase YrrM